GGDVRGGGGVVGEDGIVLGLGEALKVGFLSVNQQQVLHRKLLSCLLRRKVERSRRKSTAERFFRREIWPALPDRRQDASGGIGLTEGDPPRVPTEFSAARA